MSRPTDASLARAFREMSGRTSIGQPWTLDYFVLMVNKSAERFDSEDGTFLQTEEVCDCGYVRGSLGCDDAHKKREQITTPPERAQIPAESEHVVPSAAVMFAKLRRAEEQREEAHNAAVRAMKIACPIPTCRAELLPGQHCGGEFCGLKPCSHPGCGTPTQPNPCAFDACPRKA